MSELTANDFTVLALIAERPTHGWALAAQVARGAPVGTIWAIGRPTVYHTLDKLERGGLVSAVGLERGGRGPHRVIYAVTGEGRAVAAEWLASPLEHVRDMRSLFLLKVVLSQRAGLDLEPLLVAQRAALLPFAAWLEAQLEDRDGESPAEATVAAFRLETTGAIVRFIDSLLDSSGSAARSAPGRP
jgi:PadR family transcriptional regulator AphA